MKRMLTQQPVTEGRSSITMLRAEDALQCSLPDLYARLHTTEEGLSSLEARRRLKVAGANETTGTTQVAGIVQFLRLFLSPLVIILLIASLVTAILGDILNASIIVLIVLLGLILNFIQTYRSQRAVERLRSGVAPLASVRRDGIWQELPRRELVPGDVIRLTAGDLVPADARSIFGLVLFVFLIGVLFHHNLFESVLFAIALAVGLTPEFLPMITTVTLGQGASRMARQKVIVKHLESIQNFGSMDILCSDKTGTLTSGAMNVDQALDLTGQSSEHAFLLAYVNSSYETGIRSPLDEAILRHQYLDVKAYKKQAELPFDFERRRLSVVTREGGNCLLITKGAPESMLEICVQYERDGALRPLLTEDRERATRLYQHLSAQGFRVLAVAFRSIEMRKSYHLSDERDLVLAGFVTFADPPLADAADAIQALAHDGVQVKILTGDNEQVTRHVCSLVGLPADSIILGKDLEHMSDSALGHIVERTHVFARVSPAQKNRIILALKRRQHVVGFLGDGINDAPSLHAADVGISATSATDVARDAADIVLLECGLRVLHRGILEGRKAFGNVIKYLLMGTSSNFGNMFSMAGAFLFLPFLPMLPTQILLNNFLYDLAQVTIPTDRVDTGFMRKPQHWNIRLIRNCMLFIGPLSSIYDFLTFFLMLTVFHAQAPLFHTGWFVESLATQTLVLFVIRTAENPLRSRPSKPLAITTSLVVALGLLLPFTPLATKLGFVPLPGLFFLLLAVMTVTYLLLVELVKRRVMSMSSCGCGM